MFGRMVEGAFWAERRLAWYTALTWLMLCAPVALADEYQLPLFPSQTTSGQQGLLRVLNLSDMSGSVDIYAVDDAGTRSGPATFTLDASAAVEFDAVDLASGNAGKGLMGALGSLSNNVRLDVDTDLRVQLLVYLRAADGTLTAVHDSVRMQAKLADNGFRYLVPTFNPAINMAQASRLRLVNPGGAPAAVSISGRDDNGTAALGGEVTLTLAADGVATLTAQQLEAGDMDVSGALGAGSGSWRLLVSSDQPIQVVNLIHSATGELGNLSTTGLKGVAPADQAAFAGRFEGLSIQALTQGQSITFSAMAQGGFTESVQADGVTETFTGSYAYARAGADVGRLTQTYDDGDTCVASLFFTSVTDGWFASRCVEMDHPDGIWRGGTWSVTGEDGPPVVDDTTPALPSTGAPGDQVYTAGTAIEALILPAATGGDGTLTYSLAPGIPGLTFNATARMLSGTPSTAGAHTMTYTVTDSDGDTDMLSFTITVNESSADTSPSLPSTSAPGNQTYTAGTAIETLTLPAATGGDGTLIYSLTPGIPGLTFDAAIRQLTGTPTAAGSHAMTYTVTDSDGDTDTLSFMITVQEAGDGTTAGGCQVGQLISPGGSCTYPGTDDEFTVAADGRGRFLVISSTRAINVNNVTFKGRFYDFRASHQGDGVWRIDRLAGSTMPPIEGGTGMDMETSPRLPAAGAPADQTYTAGAAITALTLPAATGGDGTLTYSLSPQVPGLTFNATMRQLTGTPTTAGNHSMTYTVADADGDTDTLSFMITIQAATATDASPSFPTTGRPGNQTFTVGDAISTIALPVATGGDGTPTYSLSPQVPGLTFNATTRQLTGTPTTAGNHSMTYTVTDADGDTDTLSFTITVQASEDIEMEGSTQPSGFGLHAENSWPVGMAVAGGRIYVGDFLDDKLYAYTTTGDRVADSDFELDAENSRVSGITYGNGRFYVVDNLDDKVYVYESAGARAADADIDLHQDNSHPGGVAYANMRLYVVDERDDRVFAYELSGARVSSADFDVGGQNRGPEHITHGNGRFYVSDFFDDTLYAYEGTGTRDRAYDLGLVSGNSSPAGLAYSNGRILVVDGNTDRVFSYPEDRFDLVVESPSPSDSNPDVDASFTLSATVRNLGNTTSSAATLRFYRSDDDTISTDDSEMGRDSISAIGPAASVEGSIQTSLAQGCYWCGACVDSPDQEFVKTNNCSESIRFFVGDALPAADLRISSAVLHDSEPDRVGDPLRMTIGVVNDGEVESEPAMLRIAGGRNLVLELELELPALAPNETHMFERVQVGTAQLGTSRYTACIVNSPCEDAPGNNCRSDSAFYLPSEASGDGPTRILRP